MVEMKEIKSSFDIELNRRDTGSIKWNKYKDQTILPMWVADMDFRSPEPVIKALQQRVQHGVFGYTGPTEELVGMIIDRLEKKYHWKVEPDWLVWLPGLVSGLNICCRAVGSSGDKVVTTIPVYPPFLSAPDNMERTLTTSNMVLNQTRWEFDWDRLQTSLDSRSKLFLLCNPHNPLGRIFSEQELRQLAEICVKFDMVICSDEIHCDLILDKHKRHIPFATLSPDIAERTITLMSPSKTFNIAGLGLSFVVISNERLRHSFIKAKQGIVPYPNLMGYTAAYAAYNDGGPWLNNLLDYLSVNSRLVYDRIQSTSLSTSPVEATYLAWIDARSLELDDPYHYFEKAGIGFSNGAEFGAPGFLRLNFGCPRSMLKAALERVEEAIKSL